MSREKAAELVRQGKRFLVTCHRRPDGDALGSAMGFTDVLRRLGKEALTYCPEEVSSTLRFLPGVDKLTKSPSDFGGKFDGTFIMDTASKTLLPKGFPSREVSGPVVVVDHHTAYDDFADIVVRDSSVCSTGELVLDLASDLGVVPRDLSIEGATALYTAIVADTGGFRYPTTRPKTLRLGAELLEVGVEPWTVAYNLFEGWAPERVNLLQEVLATLEMFCGGRLAILTVTQEMMKRAKANADMLEGLVSYARRVRGVEVSALLWEQDAATSDIGKVPSTKVSLRATGSADVSKLAVVLGGGGHKAAAAATLPEALPAARERFLAEATRFLSA